MKRLLRTAYASLPLKRQIYAFVRDRLGIVPSFYEHLHFTGPFDLKVDSAHSIRLFSQGHIVENELFWRGYGKGWESSSLQIWKRMCERSDGIILDIGANSGVYALVAASLAPSAQVVAFEPIARVARHLRRNVDLNRLPIRVEERAVSDRDGTVAIFDLPDDTYNYSASIEGQGLGAKAVDVPVCSIDTFLASEPRRLSAVKIDVERHEPAAIAGMKNRLDKDRPAIIVEVLDAEIGRAIERHVGGLGYRMFHIVEGKGLIPCDRLEPLGGHDWNHFLCTDEQFARLGLDEFLIPAD